jgi:glycosyltransferase involved in cell wall biosynthesis
MKRAKMVFNVSDLWPESAEKLRVVTNRFLLGASYKLEKWLYKRSVLVTGQTKGICDNVVHRFPDRKVHWLPNGIDVDRFKMKDASGWRNEFGLRDDDFILVYGGILGHAQGLEVIIEAARLLKDFPSIKFVLVGDGPEKSKLEELCRSHDLKTVLFTGLIPRDDMGRVVASCNGAIVPLKKLDLFLGAIPSKIFENLALGIPVLLGVDGEAKKLFVEDGKCSLYFEPENAQALANAVRRLFTEPDLRKSLAENGKLYVYDKFDRRKITADFLQSLSSVLKK